MASTARAARQQAGALFVKSFTLQRRSWASNLCLISAPLFLCGLLAALDAIVNALRNAQPKYQVFQATCMRLSLPHCVLSWFRTPFEPCAVNTSPSQCGCQCLSCCIPYQEQSPWTADEVRWMKNGGKVGRPASSTQQRAPSPPCRPPCPRRDAASERTRAQHNPVLGLRA